MKLKLTMSLDNAAFHDDDQPDECNHVRVDEVVRILTKLAATIGNCGLIVDDEAWPLIDINGNKVGECSIS